MSTARARILVLAATVSFSFSLYAGCGGGGPEECAECGSYGAGAVKCFPGLGPPQIICAPDQTLAASQCIEGGGRYVPMTLCPAQGETGYDPGDDPGNAAWEPGDVVMFDPSVGEYIIDAEAFETIKNDPGPIFLDSSELQLNDTGYYQVALDGALSDALGWQVDDILLSLDGYPLGSLSDFAEAYTNLAEKDQFQLSVQRGRQVVVLRYRVE